MSLETPLICSRSLGPHANGLFFTGVRSLDQKPAERHSQMQFKVVMGSESPPAWLSLSTDLSITHPFQPIFFHLAYFRLAEIASFTPRIRRQVNVQMCDTCAMRNRKHEEKNVSSFQVKIQVFPTAEVF